MSKIRPKMPVSERAKQFMPFAALKGYEEALRAKELEFEEMSAHKKTSPKYPYDICEEDFDEPI